MKQTELIRQVSLKIVVLMAAWGFAGAAHGGVDYTFSSSSSQTIPDNDPSGVAYGINFTTAGLHISDVSVTFTTTGGRNGDLYAYLSHDTSGTLILLNRVGVANGTSGSTLYNYGYSWGGFNNITLSDSASGLGNIHNYGGSTLSSLPPDNGTYKADGQTASFSPPTGFSAGGGSATFANTFGGSDPYGNWTLFFADLSGGSVSTLTGWSLDITAVPEPVNVALGVFAGVLVAFALVRSRRVRNQAHRWWVAIVQWIDAV
jgi:subtilisin-like proprotein convertase family protein